MADVGQLPQTLHASLGFIVGLAFGGAMRESARCDEYHEGYVAGKGEGR